MLQKLQNRRTSIFQIPAFEPLLQLKLIVRGWILLYIFRISLYTFSDRRPPYPPYWGIFSGSTQMEPPSGIVLAILRFWHRLLWQFRTPLLGNIPKNRQQDWSSSGLGTRPWNGHRQVPPPTVSIIKVHDGQNNGPMRRGMTLFWTNETEALAYFWGCSLTDDYVFQTRLRMRNEDEENISILNR